MGKQRGVGAYGYRFRTVPGCPGHRHDRHGGILPLCDESLHSHAVFRLGHAVPYYSLAAFPGVRRADHGGRKPSDADCPERTFCSPHRLFKRDLPHHAGHRQSAIHGTHGTYHDGGRFYFCRGGGNPEQRYSELCGDHIGGGDDPNSCSADSLGLELLQAPAGR